LTIRVREKKLNKKTMRKPGGKKKYVRIPGFPSRDLGCNPTD